ncbi:hypothetical protein [Bacteroides ndongoniae]|uniref:hypothetical protein n=1 Tax=Bacteroides ndongoniae TaxID=1903262 RepID=UPI0008D9A469|nr:hypothetical protein [Bacteroides ndongoniae]
MENPRTFLTKPEEFSDKIRGVSFANPGSFPTKPGEFCPFPPHAFPDEVADIQKRYRIKHLDAGGLEHIRKQLIVNFH